MTGCGTALWMAPEVQGCSCCCFVCGCLGPEGVFACADWWAVPRGWRARRLNGPVAQVLSGALYNERVDQFSFAMCVVELLDCNLPWRGCGVVIPFFLKPVFALI
jgi:hypothetical protein